MCVQVCVQWCSCFFCSCVHWFSGHIMRQSHQAKLVPRKHSRSKVLCVFSSGYMLAIGLTQLCRADSITVTSLVFSSPSIFFGTLLFIAFQYTYFKLSTFELTHGRRRSVNMKKTKLNGQCTDQLLDRWACFDSEHLPIFWRTIIHGSGLSCCVCNTASSCSGVADVFPSMRMFDRKHFARRRVWLQYSVS